MISRAQLVRSGLGDSQIARLERHGFLTTLDRGAYTTSTTRPEWIQWAWAGVLLGGHRSRLMAASAGAIDGLCPERLPITVLIAGSGGTRSRSWVQFVRDVPGVRSERTTRWPPRTTVEDTVLDLCNAAATESEVVHVVTTASQRLTTYGRLREALARRSRQRHRRLIESVIDEVADGVRSPLESRWVRGVERPHRLPRPLRSFRVTGTAVADGAWKDFGVLLELDGRAWHEGERRVRDQQRDNRHVEGGWVTLRYGWEDVVRRPCATAQNVSRVLRTRGWQGVATRCPQCRQ